MRLSILKFVFALLIALPGFTSGGFAQNANKAPAQSPAPEITQADDRLPFMQTEQKNASSEPSSGGLMLKSLGAMLLIIGLIFFGAWSLKKLGFGGIKNKNAGDTPDLSILSTVSVGTNCSLSVVKFGQRVLLVGSTPQSFTLLADETNENSFSAPSRSVAEMLAEEISFTDEFSKAQSQLNLWEEKGGHI